MSDWKVTWGDGTNLAETIVFGCDIFGLINSYMGNRGVLIYSVIKIERLPRSQP